MIRWIAGFLVLLLLTPGGGAEEAEWQAGFARANITPHYPIRMSGYAARTAPSQGVDTELYTKAFALADSQGHRALVITADLIGFPGELAERIAGRIMDRTGLRRESILIAGSHTHAGPMVTAGLGYSLSREEREAVERYARWLEDMVVTTALEALGNLRPARLSWGVGVVHFPMNRREFTERGVILGVNPRRPADRSVPVLRVQGPDGRLRAVVFSAACHPTTLTGEHLRINADYPGYAQAWLEKAFPGAQAMFLIGCAGDANPYPRGSVELAERHGRELGTEVQRVLEQEELAPVHGPLRTELEWVELPLRRWEKDELERLASQKLPAHLRFFVDGALRLLREGKTLPSSYRAPFALWQFGQDLTLVAFSGETVSGYIYDTERELGPLKLWIIGYANDVFGYLPTAQVLAEGGYETRGLYTGVGLFAPEVEQIVMQAVRRMAQAVGRGRLEP